MNAIHKLVLTLVAGMLFCSTAFATEFIGTLSEKPKDAKEGVVAVLTVKDKAKKEEKTYNLWATGENAKKLTDLLKKTGATVKVTGDAKESDIKVDKFAEMPSKPEKKK
jgi:hypothetical protein